MPSKPTEGSTHLAALAKVEVYALVLDDLLRQTTGNHLGQHLLLGLRLARQLGTGEGNRT